MALTIQETEMIEISCRGCGATTLAPRKFAERYTLFICSLDPQCSTWWPQPVFPWFRSFFRGTGTTFWGVVDQLGTDELILETVADKERWAQISAEVDTKSLLNKLIYGEDWVDEDE